MTNNNEISLYYKEGSSDKVYTARIEEQKNGWVVNYAYGRRGSTLTTGSKTVSPVTLEKAVKIMAKLVTEKTAKGYTVDTSGAAFTSHVDKKPSGFLPQLLKPIEDTDVAAFLENDNYVAQEKIDGERRMLRKHYEVCEGINRKGLVVGLPDTILSDMQYPDTSDFVLDGEQIGDTFYAFDLLVWIDSQQKKGYRDRYQLLKQFIDQFNFKYIKLVKAISGYIPKQKLIRDLEYYGKEGIVFKDKAAAYVPGRNSGTQFKYKFYETASFVVTALNDQRSVQIAVIADDDAVLPVGNVTIPVNQGVPKKGSIIEVRYLYAYRGGSVYQPVYIKQRTDLNIEDCSIVNLKYKNESTDE